MPLLVLAALSVVAGLVNAPGILWFTDWTNNPVSYMAEIPHHDFSVPDAVLSTVVVAASIAIGYLLFFKGKLPKGVTERNGAARAGYTFLANRYYLDHVYTGGVVGSIKGPIARGAYWFNQRVIDSIVNAVGIAARRGGAWIYKYIDQGAIDGAVNGSGLGAEGLGGGLRSFIQTGRVQWYGSLLFGATAVMALILVIAV